MRVFRLWPLVLLALAGCQWVPAVPGVHVRKIDIQQGNAITPEMLSKLRLGMTRSQVRFALGTPLLVDPFRTDRWDYVYSFETGGRVVERRHVTVIFEAERLKRVEGDVPPEILTQINSGIAASTPILPPPAAGAAPPPAAGPVVAPPATGDEARPAPPDAPPPTQGDGAKPPPSDPAPESNLVSGSAGASPEARPLPETPVPEKPPAEKPAAPAPQSPPQEQGFFGRMLETLGF